MSPLRIAQKADCSAPSGVSKPTKAQGFPGTGSFDGWRCSITTPVVPVARITATPITATVFILVHAITFNAPLIRVNVDAEAVVPLVSATAEIVFAKPVGAA